QHGLGIRDGERRLVIRMAAVFAVTQSTHALGANSADALFFLRYGVEELPQVILISGLAVMVALILYVAGLGRWGPRIWLPVVTAICGLWAIVEWAASFVDAPVVYPIIWISTQVLIMVTFTVMWNAAGAASNTRQAKRLFPIFASSGVAGAVIGNLLTGPLAKLIGTETLLAVQGGALLVSAGLLVITSGLFADDPGDPSHSVRDELAGAVRVIRSTQLLKLAAGVMFAFSTLFFLVVFPFNSAVASSFGTEAGVAGFLGLFASIATGLTFLVSLLVTNRLFVRFGIVATLLVVPVMYVAGFGLWLGSFTLATAAAVRGLQWVVINAVGGTGVSALFNVVTGRLRGQVMAFMTAIPGQLGTVAGGAILLVAAGLDERGLLVIGLVVGLGALALVIRMRSAYLDAVVAAVRKGLVGVFDVPHVGLFTAHDGETLRILTRDLESPKPEERLMAVTALAKFGSLAPRDLIEPLMSDEDPKVRSAAFETMCALEPDRVVAHVTAGLTDGSPDVRRRSLWLLPPSGDERAASVAGSMLTDPDPAVRTASAILVGGSEGRAVIDGLLQGGRPDVIEAVLRELTAAESALADPRPFLHHDDPDVRAAAILAASFADLDPLELGHGLEDISMKVRHVTADVLADSDPGREVLFEALESGSVSATEVAIRALTPVDRFTDDFLSWAGREAARAAKLEGLRLAILSGPQVPSTDFLVGLLRRRSETLSGWVLLAMTTTETAAVMSIVEKGVSSEDPETRAQAVEALEVLGDRSVTTVLVALLDADVAEFATTQLEALVLLADDFDLWLRTLALHCLDERGDLDLITRGDLSGPTGGSVPSLETVPADSINTLTMVDRVIALQGVPMFSDLDPEDLQLIADIADEVQYRPGEQIYHMGDEGTDMMMIIDGEAVVSAVHEGVSVEIVRHGKGEHVGELALLQGAPRSADVKAGAEGLHALVIGKIDLMSILQERPSVTVAMLSTLATRLAART
ncbi:MAG: cyclic nucleotide-binding domain-containing protein, partial [Acidimicrobiia bacterium]